jgi:hypothetical protein
MPLGSDIAQLAAELMHEALALQKISQEKIRAALDLLAKEPPKNPPPGVTEPL